MSLPEESVAANTLPEVTTIPTGKKLIFTDPDTNEGGIITLENLSKQILQNLTSQTFTLDQGNLTLLQALNQLNSKRFKANSKAGTIYSKGITNYGAAYDAVVIHSPDISVRELGLFVMLAGSESNQFGAFIYGVSDNKVKRTEIINNGNVSVTGDPTGNSITIKIGNWGRGVVFSYARFDIEIKKL